jgi:hypothetical protein
MLSQEGVGELLEHHPGKAQQRAARPVVHHDLLGLPRVVEAHHDDDAGGHAADLSGVQLEETIVTTGTGIAELLVPAVGVLTAYAMLACDRTITITTVS